MIVKADGDVIKNRGQGDEGRVPAQGHRNPWDTAPLRVEKAGKSEVPRPWGLGGRQARVASWQWTALAGEGNGSSLQGFIWGGCGLEAVLREENACPIPEPAGHGGGVLLMGTRGHRTLERAWSRSGQRIPGL